MLVVAVLMLAGSGCVYLRLLEVKNQLGDFDEFFQVEVAENFTLHFREPVVFSDDIKYLSRLKPTSNHSVAAGKQWDYNFRKLDASGEIEDPEVNITIQMMFNRDDKMAAWSYSPNFLAIVPAELLELSLRSLGAAKIFKLKNQLRVDPDDIPKSKVKPPSRQYILDTLGKPVEIEDRKEDQRYLYRFKLKTDDTENVNKNRLFAYSKLDFDKKTDRLRKVSARFAGLKFSIDYRNLDSR